MADRPAALSAWHDVVSTKDAGRLDALLADDVVFRSPAIFRPQEGKALTTAYLTAALTVLGPTLRYIGEWFDDSSAVLEFEAELDQTIVHGVDMLQWNPDARLIRFTVMVRPMRGLQELMPRMAEQLAALGYPPR